MTNMDSMLRKAYQLLREGQLDQCEELCRKAPASQREHPDFLLLFAQLHERRGQLKIAESLYERLISAWPKQAQYHFSIGKFMRAQGRVDKAERHLRLSLEIEPTHLDAKYHLALLLLSSGGQREAVNLGRSLVSSKNKVAQYWELLAAALQRDGQPHEATIICQQGLRHCAKNPRLQYSLAQLLRENCDFMRAASAYEKAKSLGFQSPALYENYSEALSEAKKPMRALMAIREGTRLYPDNAHLHRLAARVHAESGADGDSLDFLWRSARLQASNTSLWFTLIELLRRQDRHGEARKAIAEVPDHIVNTHPGIQTMQARDLAHARDGTGSIKRFEQLISMHPHDSYVLLTFVTTLIEFGDAARAADICRRILAKDPFDQLALAHLEVCLRLTGTENTDWLVDYTAMIFLSTISVPEDYAHNDNFFARLRETLDDLHHARSQPLEQSLRGGTQTNGFLFRHPNPLLVALKRQLQIEIAQRVAAFPQVPDHPFWSRASPNAGPDDIKFSGAWSARLRSKGFHTNHIHPTGWLSGVLYVSVPNYTKNEGLGGNIQFGAPLDELKTNLKPKRFIEPRVGTLALFPSYMWHGTIPFHTDETRMTIAFDILPIN